MTKKLYYEDGYQRDFKAKVIGCQMGKKGWEIVLDQTAFYPEGGGQPADEGSLGDAEVSYVYIKDEVVYHVTDRPLEAGEEVEGHVNFEKRFDRMQQHSGEHILSGLINSKYGYNNVGFHLSSDYTTCDFDGELTREQVLELEKQANEAVYADVPIDCTIYDDSEVRERDYRSKLDLVGKIRLVTVPDYDTCACCGIHVKTTGEIGLIKCISSERHRGGTRITMLCGRRALRDYQVKQEIISEASRMLSAKPDMILSQLGKLQEELSLMKQKVTALSSELFEHKSQQLLETQEEYIYAYEKDLQGDGLRRFCLMLSEKTEKPVLVLTGEEGHFKYALGAREKDMRPLNKLLTDTFKGKGGGKSELCQGNLAGSESEIKAFYSTHYTV